MYPKYLVSAVMVVISPCMSYAQGVSGQEKPMSTLTCAALAGFSQREGRQKELFERGEQQLAEYLSTDYRGNPDEMIMKMVWLMGLPRDDERFVIGYAWRDMQQNAIILLNRETGGGHDESKTALTAQRIYDEMNCDDT